MRFSQLSILQHKARHGAVGPRVRPQEEDGDEGGVDEREGGDREPPAGGAGERRRVEGAKEGGMVRYRV